MIRVLTACLLVAIVLGFRSHHEMHLRSDDGDDLIGLIEANFPAANKEAMLE